MWLVVGESGCMGNWFGEDVVAIGGLVVGFYC